jgi:general secretion pathway protein F
VAAFTYHALDASGRETRGMVEADSSRQVRQQLRGQGLTPLRIDAAAVGAKGLERPTVERGGSRQHRISIAELALLTRQLATLLQAAMPLEEALDAVARQSEKARVRNILLATRSKVLEGRSLAQSMGQYPAAFPPLYRATVAAGEHAGHLDQVLASLADYAEQSHASRQQIKLAMVYPSVLFVLAVGVVTGLMAFVVPDVVQVFSGQGQDLPLLTRFLIGASDFVVDYGLLVLVLIGAAIGAGNYLLRNDNLRLRLHRNLLRWPLVGRVILGANAARFASTLSILTSSGVPLVEALKIAGEVLDNRYLQEAVREATRQVSEGSSLYRSLEASRAFPPMMVHMVASGELSGELDRMLSRIAEHQQRELDHLIATVIGIFEPAMLLLMGAAVMVIVLGILQPIFNLNQLL